MGWMLLHARNKMQKEAERRASSLDNSASFAAFAHAVRELLHELLIECVPLSRDHIEQHCGTTRIENLKGSAVYLHAKFVNGER